MTTSKQPWTLDGKNLRDALGNPVALFIDIRDAELVLGQQVVIEKLTKQVDELEDQVESLNEKLQRLSNAQTN